jgi:hypothetical protein
MMRDLILKVSMSDEEAALYEGRDAMVVLLSEAEVAALRGNVIGVHEFLIFNLKCLSTLQQVLESTGDREGQIAKTLQNLLEPARVAADLQDNVRELLGRAIFVGPKQERRVLQ